MSAASVAGARASAGRARWISLAFLGALAIYAWGAAPSVLDGAPAEVQTIGVAGGVPAELQTIAVAGGVAHPSGYPLYVLVSRFSVVLLPGDLAHRANLLSA